MVDLYGFLKSSHSCNFYKMLLQKLTYYIKGTQTRPSEKATPYKDHCAIKKFFLINWGGALISNMIIIFLKIKPKNTQIRHFWSQTQIIFILVRNFANSRALISNMTIIFSSSIPKIPSNQAFLI